MKRLPLLLSLLLFICISASGCAAERINSLSDPRVDLYHFSFDEYSDVGLEAFAKRYFPVGTTKEFIDSILVEQGGAKPSRRDDIPQKGLYSISYHYVHSGPLECSDNLSAVFNKDNRTVKDIWVGGGCE